MPVEKPSPVQSSEYCPCDTLNSCFEIKTESGSVVVSVNAGGNVPMINGRAAYDLSPTVPGGLVYWDGVQWAYDNINLGPSPYQTVGLGYLIPISDNVLTFWQPITNIVGSILSSGVCEDF